VILREISRTGKPIFRYHERLLSSRVDPEAEAKSWLHRLPLRPQVQTSLFLGLGGGYHLQAFGQASDQGSTSILLIEPDAELYEAVSKSVSLPAHTWICEGIAANVARRELFCDAIRDGFAWYASPASVSTNSVYFSEISEIILARTEKSFHWHLSFRPELACLLDADRISAWVRQRQENEGISVTSMKQFFRPEAVATYERRLWKVLEEMIL
jgi:hypothetical protein